MTAFKTPISSFRGVRPVRMFLVTTLLLGCFFSGAVAAERPNVIVIMSDDQGGGDYGFIGNEVIRTPELDAMHARSGYLSNFYVSPVCAPTRASLMTGRYNYRTRCIDTFVGRAMMDTDEVTLAEFLRDAGYRTGIFGKWHLGDNYPLRAMDQGFQESLIHRGGGIGQPSDPIGAEGKYTDPTLFRNGEETPMKGYCTDIFFDAAMEFITKSAEDGNHFFTYIATNAPHGPFHDVPQELYDKYKKVDFSPILVRNVGPRQLEEESDKLARIAAMITNIDQNVGRLFKKLDALGIRENTIVVYLNDNGPNTLAFRRRHAWHEDGCRRRRHSFTSIVSLACEGPIPRDFRRLVRAHRSVAYHSGCLRHPSPSGTSAGRAQLSAASDQKQLELAAAASRLASPSRQRAEALSPLCHPSTPLETGTPKRLRNREF